MSNVEDRLMKLREERVAREKARIEKLRELNLKKYNKTDISNFQPQMLLKSASASQIKTNSNIKKIGSVKNIIHLSGTTQRPITAPVPKKNKDGDNLTKTINNNEPKIEAKINYIEKNKSLKSSEGFKVPTAENKPSNFAIKATKVIDKKPIDRKPTITNKINNDKLFDRKPTTKSDKILAEIKPFKKIDPKLTRKSMAAIPKPTNIPVARKSMMPKTDTFKESVFERLYKPKYAPKKTIDEVEKLQTDPNYLKKVIRTSGLILKRHTCFETKEVKNPVVRRSISAVHFKRINKSEADKCIHKWASIGDKLNKQHLTIDEGGSIKEGGITSAIKSERKKVKFTTPITHYNTPRPEELQTRLKAWLQNRGKSLDAYHHLQCFGLHHQPRNAKFELPTVTQQHEPYDDENKENIAVESDSDDGSYTDNMIDQKDALSQGDNIDIDKWRNTSYASESVFTDFNETTDLNEITITSGDTFMNVDDLLKGALNDLAELLREGFDWEQSADYLRAIRSRFPEAPRTAAYWECRAALEEKRGDLHASVQCWEEAIAKGTERNVVEASLDTLLNKFMQLKISPNSAVTKRPDPKMVDVKNVFKSTIIRFALQQAKLQQSETPVFTVTPVRRSGRLSVCHMSGNAQRGNTPRGNTQRGNTHHGNTPRQPLRICDSVKQIQSLAPQHVFTPNKNLVQTP